MTKFSLQWQNINVILAKRERFWKTDSKCKTILEDVSGEVYSNSLVAIMGSSGSGKTTFLGAISGRLKHKTGVISINNKMASSDKIKTISGYIHQSDIFTETLTVFEHLNFKASLELPQQNKEKRILIINKFLLELGLESLKNVRIIYLSGGERRRLSLASELFKNPLILFCDEPTTGLDSYSAITVIQKLQKIAEEGRIVLTTVHQPSSQLFDCFNNIMLLAQGKLIFQGSKTETKEYFESMNLHCPVSFNPADFYIKCITQGDVSKMSDTSSRKRQVFPSTGFEDGDIAIEQFSVRSKTRRKSFFYELKWLTWRCFVDMSRNLTTHIIGYILLMAMGFILACSYAFVNLSDPNSVQNIQGLMFYVASELTFTNMYAVIYIFPEETTVFLREKSLYSPIPYFTSKLLSLVPICMLSSLSFSAMLFIITDFLQGFDLWVKMTYVMFLIAMLSCSLGLSFSATFSAVEYIDLLLGPSELVLMLVSGFWVKFNSVAIYLEWLKYLSPFFYGFTSFSTLFWKNVTFTGNCAPNGTLPCYNTGTEVLQQYGINKTYDLVSFNILCVHILTICFCLIGFCGILRKRYLYNIY